MSIYGAPTVSPYPRSPRVIRSSTGDGSSAGAPLLQSENPAPVVDPQRKRLEQNMGIYPEGRGPSNPTYAMTRAYKTLNEADAATNPNPSAPGAPSPSPGVQPTSTPGAWRGAPFKLDQTNPAPTVGGSPPPVNAPTVPNQRMNAGNGISDQVARAMYKTAMSQNPGNLAAGQQQFHDTMAKYGVNGHALLDVWGGGKAGPQTDFVTGYQTSAPSPRVDMTLGQGQQLMGAPASGGAAGGAPLLVTRPNGQTVMVDAHGQMVGPPIMQGAALPDVRTPIVGPKPGNTPLPAAASLAPTAKLDTPDQRYGQIRDDYQAPFGSNARDISPAPIVPQPPSPAQVAGAQSVLNNTPPTTRERFNAATDVATAQAQAPYAIADRRASAVENSANTRAQGAVEQQTLKNEGYAAKDESKERTATETNQTRERMTTETNQTRANVAAGNNASKEAQTTQTNETRKEVQRLKNLVGGKSGGPKNEQDKLFLQAYSKTSQFDKDYAPRNPEDRIAEAQQIMQAAGKQGATTQRSGSGATTQQADKLSPAPASVAKQYAEQVKAGKMTRDAAVNALRQQGFDPDQIDESR